MDLYLALRKPVGNLFIGSIIMSMQDPIADMFTRVRNSQAVYKKSVDMPSSNIKEAIAKILHEEGYISEFRVSTEGVKKTLSIQLKYYKEKGVIEKIQRVSKPSLRVYRGHDDFPKVNGGLGVLIVSTPEGLMTSSDALKKKLGGEVIASVE